MGNHVVKLAVAILISALPFDSAISSDDLPPLPTDQEIKAALQEIYGSPAPDEIKDAALSALISMQRLDIFENITGYRAIYPGVDIGDETVAAAAGGTVADDDETPVADPSATVAVDDELAAVTVGAGGGGATDEEFFRLINEYREIVIENKKNVEELAETIKSRPSYNSASFKCLQDYRSCTNVEFSYVCATFMIVCLAERVIPLAGD